MSEKIDLYTQNKIDLNGEWNVASINDPAIEVTSRVPAQIHSALKDADRISDPYFSDNEKSVEWVSHHDWKFEREFELRETFLRQSPVELVCEGLDTFCDILINGEKVASTNNMFRVWRFDISKYVMPGMNTITVICKGVLPIAKELQEHRPMYGWGIEEGGDKFPGGAWIRKSQCNFGWDWGPRLPTCGIWREIYLVSKKLCSIDTLRVHQVVEESQAILTCIADTRVPITDADLQCVFQLFDETHLIEEKRTSLESNETEVEFTLQNPKKWWPNNLGGQHLYTLKVSIQQASEIHHEKTVKVGVRDLKLVTEDDEWGQSFRFEANGVPFFAKGANWIPADTFPSSLKREDYRRLLSSAKEANFNMIRVWGGGIYEDDAFYEICDELGLCVWQDFMFACATYPTFDKEWMKNVEIEAVENLKRLQHHASIALWCGNNELEQGLVTDEWTDLSMSWEDYKVLFDDLLQNICKKWDPSRRYWPCSPHTPEGDRTDFNNPDRGDAHLWDVWHGKKPFEWYRTTQHRFCSEFGFQSFPDLKTIATYTRPDQYNITSYDMEFHQRSGIGNSTIIHYLLSWFRLPTGFESTVVLSQVLQGYAMKYAIEHWRRNMPRSMGALYWQLNDCWPVASWASIDYFGRWKALHYMAKRFFNPVLLSLVESKEGSIEAFVTNDYNHDLDFVLQCLVHTTEGKLVHEETTEITAHGLKSTMIKSYDFLELLDNEGPSNLIVSCNIMKDEVTISENISTFVPPKHLNLKAPDTTFKISSGHNGKEYQIRISCARPGFLSWIDLGKLDGKLSDNYFALMPGRVKIINLQLDEDSSIENLERCLKVQSVFDTYQA